MNGSSFPTQTVGADRIRPQPDETEPFVEWYNVGCCPVQPGTIEKPGLRAANSRPYRADTFIRVLAKIRGYGRLRAAPTGRMRSSGCLRKTGVTGGFEPPLQGIYVHPGACGNPGLRADSIRPYREGAFYFTLCFKK